MGELIAEVGICLLVIGLTLMMFGVISRSPILLVGYGITVVAPFIIILGIEMGD